MRSDKSIRSFSTGKRPWRRQHGSVCQADGCLHGLKMLGRATVILGLIASLDACMLPTMPIPLGGVWPGSFGSYPSPPTPEELWKRDFQEAKQGNPEAQYRLAFHATTPEAKRYWFCRSLSQKHQYRSAAFLWLGIIERDSFSNPTEAFKWLLLAKKFGRADADKELDGLRPLMTAEEIRLTEANAEGWMPRDCGSSPPESAYAPKPRPKPNMGQSQVPWRGP